MSTIPERRARAAKMAAMALLLALCSGLTYYFHVKLQTAVLFTHFFYAPIILACVWWRRTGLLVPVFLAAFLIVSDHIWEPAGLVPNDYARAAMFVVIGFVVAVLSERIARRERALAEAGDRIEHLNAVLRGIRDVNQLVVRERDPDRLLQRVCECLIGTRGYHNAWIARFDEAGHVARTAEAGLGQDFLPMADRLKRGELTACARRALEQSGAVVTEDPASACTDCPLAVNYAGRGAMTTALRHGVKTYGLICVSMPRKFVGDSEEQAFFQEVAGDVASALYGAEQERDRRRAEEALRLAARRWQTTFDGVADAMCLLDADMNVLQCNRAMADLAGRGPEKCVGLNCCELVHGSAQPPEGCPFQRMRSSLRREALELAVGERWLRITVDPVKDEEGKLTGAVHAIADITEGKRLAAQLLQAQKMEAVGQLAGGVAHDFRNQLMVIQWCAERLLRRSLVNDEGREEVHELLKAAERSAHLAGQLLAFSRKEALRPQAADPTDVVSDMSKSMSRMIGEDIRLSIVPAADICHANIDVGRLQQAIVNLVVNARDAMPGGGELTVETGWVDLDAKSVQSRADAEPGRYAMVAVTDTGAGMDEATRARIFDPFFTTKAVGEGTGLGLSIVYGFVKQSGGFIEVDSEPGKGTAVRLYFPLAEGAAQARPAAEAAQGLRPGSETILVVEDEEPVRRMLAESLREAGYTVLEAESPEKALPMARHSQARISMLITDVVMPGISGVELAEQLRRVRAASCPDAASRKPTRTC